MQKDYSRCLNYLSNYWNRLTYYLPEDRGVHIGLPNKFVTPSTNKGIFKTDQFYWDSYFIILGLVECGKGQVRIARGMIDNFAHLFKRFGIIPSRNRYYNVGISQPPFLTSMILEVFSITGDLDWMRSSIRVAEREYEGYWMDKQDRWKRHCVCKGLSRYCDHFVTHASAEHESGWDMTSRFGGRCLDHLPVDLNSCLFKYETDFAKAYGILGNRRRESYYLRKAERRKRRMSKLMWNEKKGFFLDYDYVLRRQSDFLSLAGFYPMWAGLASARQAELMRRNLRVFEFKGGLANTQKTNLSKEFKQWDYPNGWANQQWIAFRGLLNYGFNKDAIRVSKKWLDTNARVFERTGKFWEKYDVVKADVGRADRYKIQFGFGWTNGVFIRMAKELETLKTRA